ncbi:MAG: peptidoglycan editing factor PgeF [Bacteroidetes bacterium]|nr:peptidoglycan editing factor PgeF [Bacteroidota bacterium]
MSTVEGGISPGTFGLNLSYNVQDDPANVEENRRLFFGALGLTTDQVAFTSQQHTTDILTVSSPGQNDTCDALITASAGVFLAISIADCTPVMLYDPVRKVAAGIHAGWRGTAGRIVEGCIRRLQQEFGTVPHDLFAFIGPSAGVCCYEVGAEVAAQFPDQCVRPGAVKGKFLLDVKKANVLQLLDNGVRNSNIEVHKDCTIHDRRYHSHRRDGTGSGRMFAVIGITT